MDPKKLEDTLFCLTSEFRAMKAQLDSIPKTEGELAALLQELVDATDARRAHFDAFPRRDGDIGPYQSHVASPKVVEEDWSRCMRRFDEAVNRLTQFARASLPEKTGGK